MEAARVRVAFYAPMKPPDDPVPSGDRLMSRQLQVALAAAGCDVRLASRCRSFSKQPSHAAFAAIKAAAATEVERLLAEYDAAATTEWRPQAWFTYHPYYKAPDLIGPAVSQALAIPYLTAEASYAPKRDRGDWAPWQQPVGAAIRHAAVNICITARDREQIEGLAGRRGKVVELPAFLVALPAVQNRPQPAHGRPMELIAVAMMRDGDKLESFRCLAAALKRLADRPWRLTVVGDGPARETVVRLFDGLAQGRVRWLGELGADAVSRALAESDVLVWPGVGEAYGLAYLEAAAHGVPVVALRTSGVPAVVEHGRTGLLADATGDAAANFACALAEIMQDEPLRLRLGQGADSFVRNERSLAMAAGVLRRVLDDVKQDGA